MDSPICTDSAVFLVTEDTGHFSQYSACPEPNEEG